MSFLPVTCCLGPQQLSKIIRSSSSLPVRGTSGSFHPSGTGRENFQGQTAPPFEWLLSNRGNDTIFTSNRSPASYPSCSVSSLCKWNVVPSRVWLHPFSVATPLSRRRGQKCLDSSLHRCTYSAQQSWLRARISISALLLTAGRRWGRSLSSVAVVPNQDGECDSLLTHTWGQVGTRGNSFRFHSWQLITTCHLVSRWAQGCC